MPFPFSMSGHDNSCNSRQAKVYISYNGGTHSTRPQKITQVSLSRKRRITHRITLLYQQCNQAPLLSQDNEDQLCVDELAASGIIAWWLVLECLKFTNTSCSVAYIIFACFYWWVPSTIEPWVLPKCLQIGWTRHAWHSARPRFGGPKGYEYCTQTSMQTFLNIECVLD